MAEPMSLQVRRRIVELYQRGESTARIADVFGRSESGVRRVWQHFRERGTAEPAHGGGRPPRRVEDEAALRELLEQQPDALIRELRDALEQRTGTSVSRQTVGEWVAASGWRRWGCRSKKDQAGERAAASSNDRTSSKPAATSSIG
ncbi:MAG: helix-turn-helix domain-containing protein [Planctomycetota bacterium]